MAIDQLESAGLEVLNSGEARPVTHLADIGALVWYLKMIPWPYLTSLRTDTVNPFGS